MIKQQYGEFDTQLSAVELAQPSELDDLLAGFKAINWGDAGLVVSEIRDYSSGIKLDGVQLPKEQVYQVVFADGSRITCRPSGTEPLCKFYLDARSSETQARLAQLLARLFDRTGGKVRE